MEYTGSKGELRGHIGHERFMTNAASDPQAAFAILRTCPFAAATTLSVVNPNFF